MSMPRSLRLATALLLGWAVVGLAQGPAKPKDDDLDDLLKKVEQAAKPKDTAKDKDAAKPAKPGAVAPKDKDLDDFLEKLGEEKDKPKADGKPPEPPPGASDEMKPDQKGGKGDKDKKDRGKASDAPKPKKDDLTGQDKDLDEHLSGADKKKQQKGGQKGAQGKGQKQDEEDGPLGDLIKQMREVEQRLGQPDTGEQTRQKQTEIVKRLDTLIEQMRLVRSQSQMMRMMRQGQRPGQQQGMQANNDPQQGVGLQKPATPRPKSVLAKGADSWGHLPPDLRAEMDNVFREAVLPAREDLIRRYYLSVSKKSLSREE
jgi:hypothetical protein